MRSIKSLYIADSTLYTTKIDTLGALSEFHDLKDASFLSSHWIDGQFRCPDDAELSVAHVETLQFDSVHASSSWRVGSAIAGSHAHLYRLHVSIRSFAHNHREYSLLYCHTASNYAAATKMYDYLTGLASTRICQSVITFSASLPVSGKDS